MHGLDDTRVCDLLCSVLCSFFLGLAGECYIIFWACGFNDVITWGNRLNII